MPPRVTSGSRLDSREAAIRFLNERVDFERAISVPYEAREFRLDRVRDLLSRLGNPHQRLSIVHIAGTKGKGSTAAMTGAILKAAGYRTGVFTSPHLDRVEERIAVDGQPVSSDEFVALLRRVVPVVEAMDREAASRDPRESGPTYFDITTAMGLLSFVDRKVDAAVLEVGLGGRLDSTNVCQPLVSVITSISLDHTQLLGHTLASIAREKAGIIKPGVPVVSGVQAAEPRAVIREVCRRTASRLVEMGREFEATYQPPHRVESSPGTGEMDFRYLVPIRKGVAQASSLSRNSQDGCATDPFSDRPLVPGREYEYRKLRLSLLGHHQAANAAVALATLEELRTLGWSIPEKAVREGLAEVSWPARIELVSRRPAVILDAAHNLASIDALTRVLDESFAAPRRLLVLAMTQDKDVGGMLRLLLGRFDRVLFTRYLGNPRAVPPAQLETMAAELTGRHYPVYQEPAAAWDAVRSMAEPDDLICVTGSFFIAAEMREQIRLRPLG